MGCAVAPPAQPGGVEEVTFLYRLTDGACPKSYGANVARLAGLPDSVVARAAAKAHESEEARHAAATAGGDCGDGTVGGAGGARQLLQRAAAACRAAVGGEEGAAAAVLRLQAEVRRFLRLD
jgi:DNA mismatch repair ATPase MutS